MAPPERADVSSTERRAPPPRCSSPPGGGARVGSEGIGRTFCGASVDGRAPSSFRRSDGATRRSRAAHSSKSAILRVGPLVDRLPRNEHGHQAVLAEPAAILNAIRGRPSKARRPPAAPSARSGRTRQLGAESLGWGRHMTIRPLRANGSGPKGPCRLVGSVFDRLSSVVSGRSARKSPAGAGVLALAAGSVCWERTPGDPGDVQPGLSPQPTAS